MYDGGTQLSLVRGWLSCAPCVGQGPSEIQYHVNRVDNFGRYHIFPGPGGFIPGSQGQDGTGLGTPLAAEGYP
jgi:hypothetical protein